MLTKSKSPEPRYQAESWYSPIPFFGTDFEGVNAGEEIAISSAENNGYPIENFGELPPGYYYFQALINIYTQFERSDGHIIWAPMDHWKGQKFNNKPGNLYSQVDSVYLDPAKGFEITIKLDFSCSVGLSSGFFWRDMDDGP